MPYLIDSDWVIDFLAQESEALQLIEQLAQEGIAISIVTYMEVYQGVLRSQESRRHLARENSQPSLKQFQSCHSLAPWRSDAPG